MPVIKSAKKKLRQDKKRTLQNKLIKIRLKETLKKAQKNPKKENIIKAIALADKAAKKGIIHKNNAAHIKSRISKLLKSEKTSQSNPSRTKTSRALKKPQK